jgi:hypothetical protein
VTAERVRPALTAAILRLPQQLRRSLTWDHGREMTEHLQFAIDSGVQVYFCDPRSPWQRGTNENTNGLLRQYLPKGGDLRRFDQAALDKPSASRHPLRHSRRRCADSLRPPSFLRHPPLPRRGVLSRRPEPVSEINVAQPALSQGSATVPVWDFARLCPCLYHRPATPAPGRRPGACRLLSGVHRDRQRRPPRPPYP